MGKKRGEMEARARSKELLELEQEKPSFLESNIFLCKKEEEESVAAPTNSKKMKKQGQIHGAEETKQQATATVPTSHGISTSASEKPQQKGSSPGLSTRCSNSPKGCAVGQFRIPHMPLDKRAGEKGLKPLRTMASSGRNRGWGSLSQSYDLSHPPHLPGSRVLGSCCGSTGAARTKTVTNTLLKAFSYIK